MKFVLLILLSMHSLLGWEIEVKKIITAQDLRVLFCLESGNQVTAIGDSGKAAGVLQIHPSCVQEVNKYFGTSYEHADMFGRIDAVDVFYKYLAIGARHFYKRFEKLPTKEDYLRMWNGGCYAGYLKESTISYYEKFMSKAQDIAANGKMACNN